MTAPAWLDELDLRAEGPPWLAMGLRRGDDDGWLVADEHRPADLAEKQRLLAERRDDVVHLGEDTETAGAEVLALVTRWLETHPAELGGVIAQNRAITPPTSTGEHPLVTASRLVQEDLCLMVPRPGADGVVRHHLDAAVLCFPSHWRLADKAGGSAAGIHGPVPTYAEELSDKVDRYLARLRPDVIGVRRNWSIHDTPTLHAPARPDPPETTDPPRLWLRSERQTLRALPRSGAVLFTIRVQQCSFSELAERPDIATALACRLRAQPPELVAMNGLEGRLEPVAGWLECLA